MKTTNDMEVPKIVEPKAKPQEILQPVLFTVVFGLCIYLILYLIAVSLILPLLPIEEDGVAPTHIIFWTVTVSLLFALETWTGDFFLKTLKHYAMLGGVSSALIVMLVLLSLAPFIFTDDFVRSSVLSLSLLISAPFLGLATGGFFVTRRARAAN